MTIDTSTPSRDPNEREAMIAYLNRMIASFAVSARVPVETLERQAQSQEWEKNENEDHGFVLVVLALIDIRDRIKRGDHLTAP